VVPLSPHCFSSIPPLSDTIIAPLSVHYSTIILSSPFFIIPLCYYCPTTASHYFTFIYSSYIVSGIYPHYPTIICP
jgi:hypothetical protein